MKIPEGWPTEEMVQAVEGLEYDFTPGGSETVIGCVSEEMAREIFEKMLAAAPTPPAQDDAPDAWRRTQRDCCDEYYTAYYDDEDNPPVDDGNPWEPLYTRPSPPAQEDEPVAEIRLDQGEAIIDLTKILEQSVGTKFYTRPADDKLRKAAEEFVDYFNPGADVDRSPEQIAAFLQAYERKLRAALEGTPTPSNTDKQSPE